MTRLVSITFLVALVSGCASTSPDPGPAGGDPFTESDRPSSITLLVQNRNFADARLYVERRGASRTLGIVGGRTDAEFDIDWNMSDPIRIRIDLLAGPTCTTREIQADPGDILELQIEQNFSRTANCR